jgi:oligoribonuclease NrnB/cAMP/cGMP phosphodiesterase (DHH superfamily)
MLCVHHNDLDGRCSAAIVYKHYPYCRFIEMDYRRSLPIEGIAPDEVIYIVDFSLQHPGDWERLLSKTSNVIWIDHHETAIDKRPDLVNIPGIRRTDRCGAWLTWEWFNYPRPRPGRVVELVDLWDRWKHNDDDDVLDFVAGMKIRDQRPKSLVWTRLFNSLTNDSDFMTSIQNDGIIIRSYEAKNSAEIVSQVAYPVTFEGYYCLACNSNRRNSKLFDSVPVADRPEILIAYVHDGQNFTISLYSDTVKVNALAAKYGGGGHPRAAGFICDHLPWEVKS